MKLWKYSGIFLAATGVIHTILALFMGKDAFLEMVRNGIADSVDGDCKREFAFWFLICGLIIVLFGYVLHHYIRVTQRPAPLSSGYWLLAFSVAGCIFVPFSGFWLFIPQALIIIIAHRKM